MSVKIEAAEALTRKAGNLKDLGQKLSRESAMAKYYASEVAVQASTECVQIHGGYGYTKRFPCGKILPRLQTLHDWGRHLRNPEGGYFKGYCQEWRIIPLITLI